ncbi:tetraacyldisaccharide 4'-kinase [Rufibacter sediminis]|uniref:Tetraacyldisaccharide 4'-kinase n=1 Tax=Rufibacter sediminis TaxID=2762756 RepID=A0ABR6VXL9_9BACT|nr:tetraacyldisaccharide 4'-kinase [Rufibacter sediminis]MBC3541695.1 tetraacyldisaccharide 4'-kinase [Rufibacter sediminis]
MPVTTSALRFLLFPFAQLYGGIVRLRNVLYDQELFSVYQAPIPVICVGNLSVGGTGKTPQVEYLARLLQPRHIAILSRGYKRKTKGFVLADHQATAATLGDEPFQYTQSLPQVRVAVCEKRALGIQRLLQLFPDLDVILLDDAFQHRAVKASSYLLLTDFNRLFTQDYLLPMGLLREPRSGARRADAVVVTKCPRVISQEQQTLIQKQVQEYTSAGTPVFFSQIVYAPAVPVGQGTTLGKRLILVTGIANAQPLVKHLQQERYEVVRHFDWPDHAAVTPERVGEVVTFHASLRDSAISILMTQKDAVKWQEPSLTGLWRSLPVYYLPITNAFAPQEPSFDATIQRWVPPIGSDINLTFERDL